MSPRPPGPRGRSNRGRPAGRPRTSGSEVPGLGGEQVEGRQAVRELLIARRRRVKRVIAGPSDRGGPLDQLVDLAGDSGIAVRRVSQEELRAQAGSDAPQGVLAFAEPVVEANLKDLIASPGPFLVVLDGVTDPHNLGAIMRSALSAGATGLVLGRHRSARLTPAAVKAAAGAVEHLPVSRVAGIPAAISTLTGAGVWVAGLDSEAPASVWELPVATDAVALVLGAEGHGMAPLTRSRCDLLVSIPMSGPLDSLNVSAAAAVACFAVARRRTI